LMDSVWAEESRSNKDRPNVNDSYAFLVYLKALQHIR